VRTALVTLALVACSKSKPELPGKLPFLITHEVTTVVRTEIGQFPILGHARTSRSACR